MQMGMWPWVLTLFRLLECFFERFNVRWEARCLATIRGHFKQSDHLLLKVKQGGSWFGNLIVIVVLKSLPKIKTLTVT